MSTPFLFSGPEDAPVTLLLAHGSGAPMDSPAMNAAAASLAAEGLRVARFEFSYMAARRTDGSRKPPPKAETLNPEFRAAVADLRARGPLVIGGKSMGGRVASMVADDLLRTAAIVALVYLGYPFHPPGKPEATRGAHLAQIAAPQLFVEGTADPFIQPVDEFQAAVGASPDAEIVWIAGGGHSFEVRGARRPADDVGADLVASVLPWLRARFASPSHRASRESPPDPRERDGDSRETG